MGRAVLEASFYGVAVTAVKEGLVGSWCLRALVVKLAVAAVVRRV